MKINGFILLCFFYLLLGPVVSQNANKNGVKLGQLNETKKLSLALQKLHKVYDNNSKSNSNESDTLFTIIHIGDSHVQGDKFSGEIRKLLQEKFGNAGQGILFPYSLAKSFGPKGIDVSTSGSWIGLKTLSKNLAEELGLTGYGAFTNEGNASITVSVNEKFEKPSFQKIKIWHSSDEKSYVSKINDEIKLTERKTFPSGWAVSTFMSYQATTTFKLSTISTDNSQNHYGFYGFELVPTLAKGLNYHHCGVVGAQFTHFIKNAPLAIEQIMQLKPDIVIFSFGTNEAYNDVLDTATYSFKVIEFLHQLELASPNTAIIITTAPDTRSQNRIPSQQTNVNNQLKTIAQKCKASCYDLNEAMGGWGSLYNWYKHKLTLSDKLHFTNDGYALQGRLFTYDLLNLYNKVNSGDTLNLNALRQTLEESTLQLTIEENSVTPKNDSVSGVKIETTEPKKNNHQTKTHVVKKGETIFKIGKLYNVNSNSILRLNNLTEKSIIRPGQKLAIPKK